MWNYFYELEGDFEYRLNLTLEELIEDLAPFDAMSLEQSDDELYDLFIEDCEFAVSYGTKTYIFFSENDKLHNIYPPKEEVVPIIRKILEDA